MDEKLLTLLDVFADFDRFGGASVELVAWELDVDQSSITGAWTQAVNDGLLKRSGSDSTAGHKEELWRLTDRGRQTQAGAACPPPTVDHRAYDVGAHRAHPVRG